MPEAIFYLLKGEEPPALVHKVLGRMTRAFIGGVVIIRVLFWVL